MLLFFYKPTSEYPFFQSIYHFRKHIFDNINWIHSFNSTKNNFVIFAQMIISKEQLTLFNDDAHILFLMWLLIDSTGDVVIASKLFRIALLTQFAGYGCLLFSFTWNASKASFKESLRIPWWCASLMMQVSNSLDLLYCCWLIKTQAWCINDLYAQSPIDNKYSYTNWYLLTLI